MATMTHQYTIQIVTEGDGEVDHEALTDMLYSLLNDMCNTEVGNVTATAQGVTHTASQQRNDKDL